MPLMDARRALLLVIDFQARLMPAIDQSEARLAEARRLIGVARLLGVPIVATEQNPQGLGATVPGLLPAGAAKIEKFTFDATQAPALAAHLPKGREIVVIGAEAHVCVLQTVLGLRAQGRRVLVAADAVGSRKASNRKAGLARMAQEGAEIVTAEMVIFEWLADARHPKFRDALALIR
jgi:nicotinamidase-related amidase